MMMGVARRWVWAALAMTSVAPSPASAQETENVFHVEELAPGVYAAIVDPFPPMYAFANSLIIVGLDGVTVVDTQQSPSAAAAMLAEVRELTDKPVVRVVATHWHGDHVYGNQTYADAFPGVEFIAHRSVGEDMEKEGRARYEQELVDLPPTIAARQEWLDTGLGPSGRELTLEDRGAAALSLRLRTAYLEELRGLRFVPPTLSVEDRLVIDDGVREIHLLHFGPGHTRGDLLVYLPQENVVAVGDLVEDAFPYLGDADPAGWADVMDDIAGLEFSLMLPGHGPVLRDRTLFDVERRMFRALAGEVQAAVAERLGEEATLERVDLAEFRSQFSDGSERRNAAFTRNVRNAVSRAWSVEVARVTGGGN